jgi:hypothetical protein
VDVAEKVVPYFKTAKEMRSHRVSRGATIPPVALADIACPESRRRVGDTVDAAAA